VILAQPHVDDVTVVKRNGGRFFLPDSRKKPLHYSNLLLFLRKEILTVRPGSTLIVPETCVQGMTPNRREDFIHSIKYAVTLQDPGSLISVDLSCGG
jgi:hypothetical protein